MVFIGSAIGSFGGLQLLSYLYSGIFYGGVWYSLFGIPAKKLCVYPETNRDFCAISIADGVYL